MRKTPPVNRLVSMCLLALVVAGFTAGPVTAEMTHVTPTISGGAEASSLAQRSAGQIGPVGGERDATVFGTSGLVGGSAFPAYDFDDNILETGGFLFIPPDPMGAAGLDQLVSVVNVGIESRDKTGLLLWKDSLKDFFAPVAGIGAGTLGTFTFDPKVIYDQYEDRFVVVTLERWFALGGDPSDASRILLAVSKTGAPATPTAADWDYWSIDSKLTVGAIDMWADYPGFEVDEEAIYVTVNYFSFPGFAGAFDERLYIVDKGVGGGFYAGGPAAVTVHSPFDAAGIPGFKGGLAPAQVFGAAGAGPGVGTYLVQYDALTSGGPGGIEFLNVIRVNDPLGPTSFTQEFVAIGDLEDVGGVFGFPAIPDAPQSGGIETIEVNDRRTLDAVWRGNGLWVTMTIDPNLLNSPPDAGQATAHWVEISTSGVIGGASPAGLLTKAQNGNIGGEELTPGVNPVWTFFPSVAVNSLGQVKFGYSASASTVFGGAYVAGREPSDPPGTVQPSATVHAGLDYYIRTFDSPPCSASPALNRWGDYSGISVDPADDRVLWVYNEYADLRGTPTTGGCNGRPSSEDGRWGTAWGSCAFSCWRLACPQAAINAPVGQQAVFDFCIDNCGAFGETFSYSVSDANGWCSAPAGPILVPGDATGCVTVTCDIPLDAALCLTTHDVLITVTAPDGTVETCVVTLEIDCSVQVRLAAFEAERSGNGVDLSWELHDYGSSAEFNVYRELSTTGRVMLPGKPTNSGNKYAFVDDSAPATTVSYWLEELDSRVGSIWHGPVLVPAASSGMPAVLFLAPVHPNPFGKNTTISFTLPESRPVRIDVYDSRGRLVRTLVDGVRGPGEYFTAWDGRMSSGVSAAPGLYIVKMQAGSEARTTKAIFTR